MPDEIYVMGHKNPDTDSICSSIAYADLKTKLGIYNKEIKAVRLGKINKETDFVLRKFNFEEPQFLCDVNIRISDLDLYPAINLSKNDPIKKAWDILKNGHGIIPVLDSENRIEGIITLGMITKVYMDSAENFSHYKISFGNLNQILNGKIISGKCDHSAYVKNIYVNNARIENIDPFDVLITDSVDLAFEFSNKCCVILFGKENLNLNEKSSGLIILTEFSLIQIINLVNQAISIASVMLKENIVSLSADNFIEEATELLRTYRYLPVIDRDGKFLGIISRRHLISYKPKEIILVDHNERKQSVEGISNANILEIIDHHRIADVQTNSPLFVRSEPLGATATIIYRMYKENGIEIPKNIGGLLLSAILSDTLMLNSPTCTQVDIDSAYELSDLIGQDIKKFGEEMFKFGASLDGYGPSDILRIDFKQFSFEKYRVVISQVNTLDFKSISDMHDEIIFELEKFCIELGCDLAILMVTNVVTVSSKLYIGGKNKNLAQKAFSMRDDNILLEGIVSRKKQIVPELIKSARNDF